MNRLTAEDIHEAEKDLAATATANNNRDDLELQLDEEEECEGEAEAKVGVHQFDVGDSGHDGAFHGRDRENQGDGRSRSSGYSRSIGDNAQARWFARLPDRHICYS